MKKSYRTSTKKSKRWISGPDAAASGKFGCPLGVFPAPAFVADFPPVAPEFHQRTHRVRLRNLGTTDKKSSHKIRHRKIPREHQGFWGKKLMEAILMRAGSFMAVIILGYVLKKVGFFKEEDFYVMSKIMVKITLPASIIVNFSQTKMEPSMFLLCLLGFGGGILYMALGWIMGGKDPDEKGFQILNLSGYSIGSFTMPFTSSFFGPAGVVVTSLFDTGNAVIALGGSYSIGAMVKNREKKFSFIPLCKTLLCSVPFDAYLFMYILYWLHLSLPAPVLNIAQLVANANAFLAMLMLGVGFKLSGDRTQMSKIVKMLGVRYGVAVLTAAAFYFLLPFSLEYRKALAVLVFSPIAAAAPAFTADLKGDINLASAVNSLSIIISMFCITCVLIAVL